MPDVEYKVGDVGDDARVILGDGNYLLDLRIENAADAEWLVAWIREQEGARVYHGPLLPRLEPLVLRNRAPELAAVGQFCEASEDSLLYIVGLAGMGKSTVARAAISVRGTKTPAVWITCEGLDVDLLLAELDIGLKLDVRAVLSDPKAGLARKINAVLGGLTGNSIVVLDGFEAVLDEKGAIAPGVNDLMDAFVELDQHAKVIATTRRTPAGVGKGSPGIQIYDLRGLGAADAEQLFRIRAERAAYAEPSEAPEEMLEKLGGHPKMIELAASATAELPIEQVAEGVLQASDVGEFVVGQVLEQLDESELTVLRAGSVFRSSFPFAALEAVVDSLDPGLEIEQPVRRLVRRSVFETTSGSGLSYSVHPVLREAVGSSTDVQARAHSAAAAWFLRESIDPEDLASWDPGLYHLSRAASLDPDAFVEPYLDFLMTNDRDLTFAGWPQRLLQEYQHLFEIAADSEFGAQVASSLAMTLSQLGDDDRAVELLTSAVAHFQGLVEEGGNDADEFRELLLLIKLILAETLASQAGQLGEDAEESEAAVWDSILRRATEVVDEVDGMRESDNTFLEMKTAAVRCKIAKARSDYGELLLRAREFMDSATRLTESDPDPTYENYLSEACFSLGLAELMDGQLEEGIGHMVDQLRIKVRIGNLPGVSSAMLNVGLVWATFELSAVVCSAFIITSWQICLDTGLPIDWEDGALLEFIAPGLNDPLFVEAGLEAIEGVSPKLVPYLERGLARLADSTH